MASEYIGVNGVARKVPTHYIGVDGVARNVKSGYVGVDGVARLFFAPANNEPVILEVEKVVSDTYANETAYTAEEFILLDIYPKTNGTVKVSYGGLTKTITDTSGAAEPNAQQVFFGTLNGISDSVATPSNGELIIEGACYAFSCGTYAKNSKGLSSYCSCITNIEQMGEYITSIPSHAFYNCKKLTSVNIPESVTSIGNSAFFGCSELSSISSIQCETIGERAFYGCLKLSSIPLADGVISIGREAFCLGTSADVFSSSPMYKGRVTIPSTVQLIGLLAFTTQTVDSSSPDSYVNDGYLYEIQFLSTVPPIENGYGLRNVFGEGSRLKKMIVPKGCIEAYKAVVDSSWNDYIVEAT